MKGLVITLLLGTLFGLVWAQVGPRIGLPTNDWPYWAVCVIAGLAIGLLALSFDDE